MSTRDLARLSPGRPLLALAALALAFLATLAAAQSFPPLTGRVVDEAGILSPEAEAALEPKLAALEQRSGIQLVVATVPSLQGQEIEPYANGLFRAWKLGEADRNNGALLLVAPNERRVRIEVGYGLEGTLTDALSKVIITNAITPRFKAGDFDGGVARGVDDIITVLTTDASEWEARPELRLDRAPEGDAAGWPAALLFFGFVALFILSRGFRRFVNAMLFGMLISQGGGRSGQYRGGRSGGGGWSGGGGGFSGGGGSSGGGGASGSW
ncbi:TPM domain-containing protein [Amaricoccus solimangrovi]|uniref:TPM domain-containing protein n=1 Tax=Amaricoccus solimangrovi TaxID=2589815 RepID=A0A501WCR1_9RHOB|nr:TPM domain-containing protein [Amaricoccus solimangrovi]TPE47723.1 hypothetical protein FJM51_19585 [Amaricoccus solimangrovi]